jgi:hypothetical protein
MKKFATILFLAALLPLGACTVYGPGPSYGGAWANYDPNYEVGYGGYGPGGYCPPGYGDPNAYYYGGGYGGGYGPGISANVGVGPIGVGAGVGPGGIGVGVGAYRGGYYGGY